MSKAAPAKAKPITDEALAKLVTRQQRAIAAGKRGYKISDQLTDEIALHLRDGRTVDLGKGRMAKLKDKFADSNRVGYGGAVRRFEVEVTEAEDVKL